MTRMGSHLHKRRVDGKHAPLSPSLHSGVQLGVKVYNLVGSTSKRTSVVSPAFFRGLTRRPISSWLCPFILYLFPPSLSELHLAGQE
jgi:hypothetical protein